MKQGFFERHGGDIIILILIIGAVCSIANFVIHLK